MQEVWKPVVGFEELYEVSNLGNVRSWADLHGGRRCEPRLLKSSIGSAGYLLVTLFKEGKKKTSSVHRLVAEAFLLNPSGLPMINHRDEDKTNNLVSNLEWCDNRYNQLWGSAREKIAKSKAKKVLQFDLSENLVKTWSSAKEVERQTGFSQGYISNCCLGKFRTAYHFIWKYA